MSLLSLHSLASPERGWTRLHRLDISDRHKEACRLRQMVQYRLSSSRHLLHNRQIPMHIADSPPVAVRQPRRTFARQRLLWPFRPESALDIIRSYQPTRPSIFIRLSLDLTEVFFLACNKSIERTFDFYLWSICVTFHVFFHFVRLKLDSCDKPRENSIDLITRKKQIHRSIVVSK